MCVIHFWIYTAKNASIAVGTQYISTSLYQRDEH